MVDKFKFIIVCCLISCGFGFASPLNISDTDLPKIEALYKELMIKNYFSYTVFGSKPITVFSFSPIYDEKTFQLIRTECLMDYYYQIWKKYQVPTPNYAFIEEHIDGLFNLLIVNKTNARRVISENIDLFQKHYKEEFSTEQILDKILLTKSYFDEFGNNQILYGIMFGFGRTNSIYFHHINEFELPVIYGVAFNTDEDIFFPLPLPYFMVFESNDEVYNLRKKYEKERKEILDLYSKGDFLQITLEKMAQD